MDLNIVFSSLVLALLLLLPLALKWEIKIKYALAAALTFGLLTGLILSSDWLRANLHFLPIPLLEFALITIMTTLAVILLFYRDPGREPPKQKGIIVAPADGTVLYVKKVHKGKVPFSQKKGRKIELRELAKTSLLADTSHLVGIGMNLLNVHVNRAPIEGKVIQLKHIKGSFASLKAFDALLQNERMTTVIDNGSFKVGVIQIASRLVRRIISFLNDGDTVQIGQRIGMIKFGSQVDLVIPELQNLKIRIVPGCEVIAGESVIAMYTEESQ